MIMAFGRKSPMAVAGQLAHRELDIAANSPGLSDAGTNRRHERDRRLLLTIGISGLARMLTIIVPLVTTPITLRYLGPERYGLWMTVTSFVGMLTFADLGMGNGLLTLLSNSHGRDDAAAIRRFISSAFCVLGLMAAMVTGALLAVGHLIPWGRLINTSSPELIAESRQVAFVCIVGFALSLPTSVVQRVQLALQDGFRSSLWQMAGNLASMALLVTAVHFRVGIALLVACVVMIPPLAATLNSWVYFGFERPEYRPGWSHIDRGAIRILLRMGALYLVLSVLTALSLSLDNVIVAHVMGIGAVAVFAIPARISAMLFAIINLINIPLWTATGEAFARKDFKWIRRTVARMILLSAGATFIFGVALVVIGPGAIQLWIGDSITVPRSLLSGFAFWSFVLAVAAPLFMVLNGAGMLVSQIRMFCVFVPISLGLKVLLATRFGTAGVPWGTGAAYAVIILPLLVVALRQIVPNEETIASRPL